MEAGGSSEDKDGSEGRKKKNRWVSPFESFKRLVDINYIFYPIGIKTCFKLLSPRCATCKKKLGLTGFTCRCGGLFCSIHRYSDKHQCDFDYKVIISLKLVSFRYKTIILRFHSTRW